LRLKKSLKNVQNMFKVGADIGIEIIEYEEEEEEEE
jgi:hypothetical protein